MSIVAPTATAERLRSAETFAVSEPPAVRARWGTDAPEAEQSSLLVQEADAATEVARQHALLGAPMAQDQVVVTGLRAGLEGRMVELAYGGRLGVAGVARMLVTRTRQLPAVGQTELYGLVRL